MTPWCLAFPPPALFFVCTQDMMVLSTATENSSLSQKDIIDVFSQLKAACNAWLTVKSNCEAMIRSSIFYYTEEPKAMKFMPLIEN